MAPGCRCWWQVLPLVCVAINCAFYSSVCKCNKAATCLDSVCVYIHYSNSGNETTRALAPLWHLLLVNVLWWRALQWGQWSSGSQGSGHLHLLLLCSATHTDWPYTHTHTHTHRCTHRHNGLPSHQSNNRPIHYSLLQTVLTTCWHTVTPA